MDIHKVHLVTFSPTHTSRRIGEAIAQGTGYPDVTVTDVTLQPAGELEIERDTLTIFTVPVYGGHMPVLAMKRMEEILTDGAPAVVVVVYGNRAYEQALIELKVFVSMLEFKIIAGGTFIGEHSYSSDRFPIATGRPDAQDLECARLFGRNIREKVEKATDWEHLREVDVSRIQRPRQPFLPKLRFLYNVLKMRRRGQILPASPMADASRCTHCGLCAAHCPTGAIPEGDECSVVPDRCIRCCACVKGCPRKARTYDTPFAPLLAPNFKERKENKTIL